MKHAAAIALLAGCYAPAAAPGAPCDPLGPRCPSGQECQPTGGGFICTGDGPSGPTIDAPSILDDRDGDGVPNVADNCPDAPNPKQYDEDRDARGDACDKCPAFPSLGDPDGDNDGVGDGCDPNPAVAGDRIALFESFEDGIPAAWTRTGTWLAFAGAAVHMPSGTMLATMVVPLDAAPQQTISAGVTIVDGGTASGAIGIVDRFEGNGGVHCGSGRALGEFFGLVNAANGAVIKSVAYPFGIGSLTIALRRKADAYECAGIDLTSKRVVEDSPNLNNLGAKVGLRARTATASYHWFMVVTSQ